MKKILFIFVFLFLCFISSCNESSIKIVNMEEKNGEYYLTVDKIANFITITDYVETNQTYIIETIPNDLKINASSIYLEDGENIVIIKQDDKEFILHFFKEYDVNIELVDENESSLYQFEVLVNSKLSFDEIQSKINVLDGYFWDGEVIYNNEKVNIESLTAVSSMKLTVVLKPKQYQITVKDELNLIDEYTINIGFKENIEFNITEIEGYKFLGVYANEQLIENGMKYSPEMGTTFIMKYEPKTFKITYSYDNKEESVDILYGGTINEFIPIVDGYTFINWELNGNIFDNTIYNFTFDITLYGKFEVNTYNIFYQNIDNPYSFKITYGSTFELPIPRKEGFEFLGWFLNDKQIENGKFNYTYDIILIAKWKELKIHLNLETFGGIVSADADISNDGYIVLPIPEKEDFMFVGWYYDIYYQNKVENVLANEYKNEILYAKYNNNSDYYIDSFVVSKYNEHIENYDVLTMFDSSQSGFASKYWYKIGVSFSGNNYYVSGIAGNGTPLSSLNSYDFVILAYSKYTLYDQFESSNISIGTKVCFSVDPTLIETNDVCILVSFINCDVSEYYGEILDYLTSVYSKYNEIEQNITLIDNYNNIPIIWESSHNDIISCTGVFRKPASNVSVTLNAYVNNEKIFEFTVTAKGDGKSNALATGYIYTPYSTITQNAMNSLDIIYCAFLDFDTNADFTNSTKMTNNINNYIKPLANKSGTKIVVSINQGPSGAFSAVAASPSLREKLAENVLNFIQTLGIDGVDVDWEVPASSEIENFTLLMKTIYEKVKKANPSYLVTAAIGGGKWQPPKYDLTNSPKYMDYINLMTYSMATGNGYYQNALYKSTKKATLTSCSIDESVKIFNDYGIENSKILVGIPFYLTVQTSCGGPGSLTGTGKSIWYNQLETTYAVSDTMKEYFDEECGVPYRYDSVNKIFVSYENEKSIKRKCEYINANGLAGIMYWQYGQDVNDLLSNAIAKYINA